MADKDAKSSGQLAALVSGAVAFAGVAISATNIWVAYINKSKDLDIATRKEFREFVAANRTIIYGGDPVSAEYIRNVMRITFPKDLWEPAFRQIELNVPRQIQELFSTNNVQGKTITGRVNTWGGPNDAGTAPNEGLALIDLADLPKFSKYFLPEVATRNLGPSAAVKSGIVLCRGTLELRRNAEIVSQEPLGHRYQSKKRQVGESAARRLGTIGFNRPRRRHITRARCRTRASRR